MYINILQTLFITVSMHVCGYDYSVSTVVLSDHLQPKLPDRNNKDMDISLDINKDHRNLYGILAYDFLF